MARDYNQQQPDGSWVHVTQSDNGTYTTTPIPPSGYGAANIPGGSGGGGSTYSTPNGTKTLAQMQAELQGANWGGDFNDPNAVLAAYMATASGTSSTGYGTDLGVDQLALDAANNAAVNAYNLWREKNGDDTLAFQKAQQAWTQTYQTAQLTGTLNGSPTLDLLKFDASLSGPANAFKYAQALEGTPKGFPDVVDAARGQYQLPGFGGGDGQPITPLSVQSLTNDINQYRPGTAPSTGAPAATNQVANAQTSSTGAPAPAANSYVPQYAPLPTPNGIAPQAWNQMDPSQQQLLLAAYGQQGYNQNDVLAEFNKSLRGYGGPQIGSVGF